MANEFVARNGVIAQNNSVVSGSLVVTNGITGSLFGTSSQALSASYTATSSFGLNAISASYAFTASSAISSSLSQTASFSLRGSGSFTGSFSGSVTASLFGTASQATSASYAFTASSAVSSSYAYTASSATTASTVIATVTGTNSTELVRGNMADNDQFRILVGGTATNAGYAEIATADDGTEPIHVRQYSGVFASLVRTATLLDGSGNTSFPGIVSASFSGSLNGTASFASNYLGSGSISTRLTNLETASANLTTASGSFSTRVTQIERTYATTGSNIFTGSQNILGAITASAALINGTITAQTLVVTTVSSSVVFSSGSNIFGNSTANTQTMTGSLNVSGSATIVGRVTATDLTGSLFGTASQALTASYVLASGVVGLNLSLISTGSVSASVGQSTSSFQVTSGSNTLMILNNSGSLTIGSSPASQLVLRVSRNITGNAISRGVIVDGTIQTDVTSTALMFSTSPTTVASAFTLPTLYNYYASGVSTGSSSTVTNQYGFYAESNMINATNNYGFFGNIPSGSNRWNLYMADTAPNYIAGNLVIGTTTVPGSRLGIAHDTDFGINILNVGTGGLNWQIGSTNNSYAAGGGKLIFTYGDLSANSILTLVQSSNNVGINKTSPTTTLDVSGSVLITGSLGVTGPITGSSFTTTGTITAQTLIVQTVSSSIEFVTGSTKFGSLLTNTHQFTGSVTMTGSLAVNGSSVILTNQTSSMSVLSSSYALSASYAQSASYADNLVVNGTFTFDATLTDYASVGSSIVGSNNLFTRATSSYTSVFVNYTAAKGTSARSGQLVAVWNNGATQFTDNSTLDVGGDTGYVTMSAAIVTNQIQVNAQTNSSGWVIKSMATYM